LEENKEFVDLEIDPKLVETTYTCVIEKARNLDFGK
jgi:hypothetical protein